MKRTGSFAFASAFAAADTSAFASADAAAAVAAAAASANACNAFQLRRHDGVRRDACARGAAATAARGGGEARSLDAHGRGGVHREQEAAIQGLWRKQGPRYRPAP